MTKTNFERLLEGVGSFFEKKLAEAEAAKRTQKKKRQPKLAPNQSVIEISFVVQFDYSSRRAIEAEMKHFYENAPIPFVEVYDTEIFTTHIKGRFIALPSFKVLVAAEPKVAKLEMVERCHKIVESEEGMIGFSVKIDKSFL